jgi:hypothetical protein
MGKSLQSLWRRYVMIDIEFDDALKTLISFDERDACLEEI